HWISRSAHPRFQLYRLAIHDELSVAAMMDGLRVSKRRLDPGLEHLQDKQIVFLDEPDVGHFAFEIGETLGDQWRRYALRWQRSQVESFEFCDIAARAIADFDDLGREIDRGDGDHAFSGGPQRRKAVIGLAYDTGDERGYEFHHHMPRQRHDIDPVLVGSRQQDHRAR